MKTLKQQLQSLWFPDHELKGVPVMSWHRPTDKELDMIIGEFKKWFEPELEEILRGLQKYLGEPNLEREHPNKTFLRTEGKVKKLLEKLKGDKKDAV